MPPRRGRYHSREGAACALRVMNGLKLDERAIQVDWDRGFRAGRQYGRARAPRHDGGRPGWRQHDKRPYERDHYDERNAKRQQMGRPDE